MSNLDKFPKSEKKTFWSRVTKTELILTIILSVILIHYLNQKYLAKKPEIEHCVNYECYKSIIEIQEFIDPSTDPCQDFHQFSCGGFFENAYKKQMSPQLLQEQTQLDNELDSMILQAISEKDSEAIKIQKTFYQACLNTDEIDSNGDQRIFDFIAEIGGFPLLQGSNWKENDFDWTQVMTKCRKLGLPFQWFLEFDLYVYEDINYLKISYPSHDELPLQMRKNILMSFLRKKVNINEILEFEKKLYILLSKQNDYITLNTVEELQSLHPLFNWINFLNNITKPYEISAEMEIASNVKNYIVQLYQLLKGTPKRTQANYIIWKIIEFFAPFMSQRVRQHLNATTSETCEITTKENFRYFSEIEYIKKYSTEEVRNSATELKNAIRVEFLNRLQHSTWWNSTAAEIYFEKFNNTEIDIGLNLALVDSEVIETNYFHIGNLTRKNLDIIEILINRSKNFYNSLFSQVNKTGAKPEEKKLVELINTIDIFYSPELNKIVVPPSNLHGFLYNSQRPQFLNFASLGAQIAQQFIKSLETFTDDDNATNAIFETSNKCFEEDITEEMDLKNTIVEEVFVDIVARDIAYSAYQTWVSQFEKEPELPILGFSPNQIFWIKSSLANCRINPESENFSVIVSKYRNNFSAKHSRFFAQDFNCPEKSAMNPAKKC